MRQKYLTPPRSASSKCSACGSLKGPQHPCMSHFQAVLLLNFDILWTPIWWPSCVMALHDFGVLCTGTIHDSGGKFPCSAHWTLFSSFTLNSYLGKGLTEHTASSGCNSKALWTQPGSASKCSSGDNHHRGICSFSICYRRSQGPFTGLTCLELAEMCVQPWKWYLCFLCHAFHFLSLLDWI